MYAHLQMSWHKYLHIPLKGRQMYPIVIGKSLWDTYSTKYSYSVENNTYQLTIKDVKSSDQGMYYFKIGEKKLHKFVLAFTGTYSLMTIE